MAPKSSIKPYKLKATDGQNDVDKMTHGWLFFQVEHILPGRLRMMTKQMDWWNMSQMAKLKMMMKQTNSEVHLKTFLQVLQ